MAIFYKEAEKRKRANLKRWLPPTEFETGTQWTTGSSARCHYEHFLHCSRKDPHLFSHRCRKPKRSHITLIVLLPFTPFSFFCKHPLAKFSWVSENSHAELPQLSRTVKWSTKSGSGNGLRPIQRKLLPWALPGTKQGLFSSSAHFHWSLFCMLIHL